MNEENKKAVEELKTIFRANTAVANENLWANIFHDTIVGSRWLINQSFSSGRAAIGYPALYALYRILDELQPESILEMGLGQSTKMISSYAKWKAGRGEQCRHYIVEHDKSWIDFFQRSFELSPATEIVRLEMVTPNISLDGEDTAVNVYAGFADYFKDKQFDLIFIDGPLGSPALSRVDIVDILPECLNPSFVLMMDDANRLGENNTMKMIGNLLRENGISYSFNYYTGEKATAILTSWDLHFFCTM